MIDVKQAVKIASDFFTNLYGQELSLSGIQLEEVELTEDGKYWLITLGYPSASTNPLLIQNRKVYKVFQINAETGEVQSMKIREVA